MITGMPPTDLPPVRGLVLAAGEGRRMGGPKALVRAVAGGPTFVESAIEVVLAGGCHGVTVVVGAAAEEVTRVVKVRDRPGGIEAGDWRADIEGGDWRGDVEGRDWRGDVDVVLCRDWAEGMGASLRAGLAAVSARPEVEAVLVTLVDLPDVGPDVIARLLTLPTPAPTAPNAAFEVEPTGAPLSSATNPEFEEGPRPASWRATLRRAAYVGMPGHPALIGRDFWEATIATAVGDRGARDVYRTHSHELVECGDLATGHDVDTPADLERSARGRPHGDRPSGIGPSE
jgi:nicotine blue oxidoreductase